MKLFLVITICVLLLTTTTVLSKPGTLRNRRLLSKRDVVVDLSNASSEDIIDIINDIIMSNSPAPVETPETGYLCCRTTGPCRKCVFGVTCIKECCKFQGNGVCTLPFKNAGYLPTPPGPAPTPPPAPPAPAPPTPGPAPPAGSFPVSGITLTPATFAALENGAAGSTKDALATLQVIPGLRQFFNQANILQVNPADVGEINGALPNQEISSSCKASVNMRETTIAGKLLDSSYFKWGVSNINWKGATVFADVSLDSSINIATKITVKTGKKFIKVKKFKVKKKCYGIAHKTVGINLVTKGKTALGLQMTASNAKIEKNPNAPGYALVFNFHADVVGMVLSWEVIDVHASKCKIKILGITIISFCGIIEKALKKGINTLSAGALKILVPQLIQKLENAINTKVGSVVRIPLTLSASDNTQDVNDEKVVDEKVDEDAADAMELYSEDVM